MRDPQRPVLAGILALAGLIGLAGVIVFVGHGGGWFWAGGRMLDVRLDGAPGVRVGTPVTVGGVRIGHVRRLAFADPATLSGGFVVRCGVADEITLRRGTTARVVTAGLGGGQTALELIPGPADEPPLESGAAIHGEALSAAGSLVPPTLVWALERTADRVGLAADALTPTLTDVQRLVEPRTAVAVDSGVASGNLASAVARLDAAVAGLAELLGTPEARRKLRESLDNLHAASSDGRALLADARVAFGAARTALAGAEQLMADSRLAVGTLNQNVSEATAKLNRSLDLAASVLGALDPLAARLARGEGTLGKLIADDRLYEGFVLMLRRLGEERR